MYVFKKFLQNTFFIGLSYLYEKPQTTIQHSVEPLVKKYYNTNTNYLTLGRCIKDQVR